MTLGLVLRIVARKKPLVTLALGLAVVSMVSTAIIQSGGILESANSLAEKLLKQRDKLVYTSKCRGPCARQCTVIVKTGKGEAQTTLTIIPEDLGVGPRPPSGGVGVGYLLQNQLGAGKGDNITVIHDGVSLTLPVAGVYRSGSPLDNGLIAGGGFDWCNEFMLRVENVSPASYTGAFTGQVEGLVKHWGLAGLLVLGLGSVVAGVKAYMDLEPEAGTLIAEGGSLSSLTGALAVFFGLAVLAGYGWGLILTDLLDSLVASITGLYIPRGSLTLEDFMVQGLLPSLLAGLTVLLVGAVYAGRRVQASV